MVAYHGAGFRGARSVSGYRAKSPYYDGKPAPRSIFALTRTKTFVFLIAVLIFTKVHIDIRVRAREGGRGGGGSS